MSPTRPADDPQVVLHTAIEQLTVEVMGELDRRAARELRAVLTRVIGAGRRPVRLDLSKVTFVGRPGTEALTEAFAAAESAGADVAVVRASASVRRALQEAGLGRLVGAAPAGDAVIDVTDEVDVTDASDVDVTDVAAERPPDE